jgi:subtilisin-like proprotein convertase family protein
MSTRQGSACPEAFEKRRNLEKMISPSEMKAHFLRSTGGIIVALGLLLAPTGRADGPTTFTNSATITINSDSTATPYPSNLIVSEMGGTITAVTVRVSGFTHPSPEDVNMMLVSPTGAAFVFMGNCGGHSQVSNVNLTFADGATRLSETTPIVSGTFAPTVYPGSAAQFPAPAPATPDEAQPQGTSTFANVFDGENPNGTWQLFIYDDANGGGGELSLGWSLTLTTSADRPPLANPDTLGVFENTPVTVAGANFLANDTDPDNDTLSLVNVMASTELKSGTVSLSGGNVTYTPHANYTGTDSFTYVISDGRGGMATGTVNVTIGLKSAFKITSIKHSASEVVLNATGIPGGYYFIQNAQAVDGAFTDLSGQLHAAADGTFTYDDTTLPQPTVRFYQAVEH